MKLKTGYSDLTPSEAVELGDEVGKNMTGLHVWAALAALLTQLPLDVQAVRDAMAATGPGASAQVRLAEAKLAETLGEIAEGANDTEGATEADLAGTGLPAMKQRVALTEPPPAPTNLRLKHGSMPGAVNGTVDPIPGGNIRSYEGQWALNPDNGAWSETLTFPNSRSLRFSDLARGKDTWFRVRARNTVGAGAWCDPATIMVT